MDVDHNGTISRAEFIAAYGEEAAIKEFDKVDINHDGELQAGEYMAEYGKQGRERLLRSVHYGIAPEEHPIPNMDFDHIMSKPWNYKVKHPTKTGFRKHAAKVEVDLASIVAQYSTGIREPVAPQFKTQTKKEYERPQDGSVQLPWKGQSRQPVYDRQVDVRSYSGYSTGVGVVTEPKELTRNEFAGERRTAYQPVVDDSAYGYGRSGFSYSRAGSRVII